MSDMIDRYVEEAVRHVSRDQRADATRDIRGMVDELVEARIAAGEESEQAMVASLNELGDPRNVARGYDERPMYLIGPRYFEHYWSLITSLLSWIPASAFIVLLSINFLSSEGSLIDGLVEGGLDAAGTAFVIAVQIVFWVTLTYAVIERVEPSDGAVPSEQSAWTVADLPAERPRRQIGLADTVWSIGVMAFLGTWLIAQHQRGIEAFVRSDEITERLAGREVPFFNPEIPGWVGAVALALIAVTIVLEIAKFAVGNWTLSLTVAEIVSSIAWIALPVLVLREWALVNPETDRIWDNDLTGWVTGSDFERLFLLGIVIVSAMAILEAVRGHLAYRQRGHVSGRTGDNPGQESTSVFIV